MSGETDEEKKKRRIPAIGLVCLGCVVTGFQVRVSG